MKRLSVSFAAVFSSAHPTRSISPASTPSRGPMKRIRTPSSSSSGVSPSIRSPNIAISPETSSGLRDQFSVEKENTVSSSIPRSTASRSRALTTSAPARCPSITGSPRACAPRPFPSVMIATYRGVEAPKIRAASDLEDFRFLALQERVDLGDRLVGLFLQRGLGATLVVLAQFALVFHVGEGGH